MNSTVLQKAKMGLCQMITGCDGGFLMPCGHKRDNPKYCEIWKGVSVQRKDLLNGTMNISSCKFEEVKRDFISKVTKKGS